MSAHIRRGARLRVVCHSVTADEDEPNPKGNPIKSVNIPVSLASKLDLRRRERERCRNVDVDVDLDFDGDGDLDMAGER